MTLSKRLRWIILVLFLIGAVLHFILEASTVHQSVLDQMFTALETAITALDLLSQGALLNDGKVLAETIVNTMFDGGFVSAVTLIGPVQLQFQKVVHPAPQNAPSWLPSVIGMPPVKIEQELIDGWHMLGTLTQEGRSGEGNQPSGAP